MKIYLTMIVQDDEKIKLLDATAFRPTAIKQVKEIHIPNFIKMKQRKICTLLLCRVDISNQDFCFLKEYLEHKRKTSADRNKANEMLLTLYNNEEYYQVYSFSIVTILEIAEYYCKINNIEITEDNFYDVIQDTVEKFEKDEELFNSMLKEHLKTIV